MRLDFRLDVGQAADSVTVRANATAVNTESPALGEVIENAVEFSPDGGRVVVTTSARNGSASLTVADEGPGIEPAHRERIFERFYRADASRTRRTGGSGLGLAIARELVEAQGGRISVAPRPGGGSLFEVRL